MQNPSWLDSWSPWQRSIGTWLVYAGWTFLLAIFDHFSVFLIAPILIFAIGISVYSLLQLWQDRDHWMLALFGSAVLLSFVLALTASPTVFGGRDQGAIAEAAWRLAQHGSVSFHTQTADTFFAIYGPGQALNFPGFFYTESGALVTQFPLGYTSWLASFIALFGFSGFTTANLILFCLTLWTCFELLRRFMSPRMAWVGATLYGFSFLPLWLSQFSLSENLAALLFFVLALLLIRLRDQFRVTDFILMLLTAGFFPFVRIEGFAFLALACLWCIGIRSIRTSLFERPVIRLGLPLLMWLFVFSRAFVVDLPFFTTIAKAILKHVHVFQSLASVGDSPSINLAAVFFPYGILLVFVLGGVGILFLIRNHSFRPLALLFLAAPTLWYFIDPSISADHPWLLRRYATSLYPTFFCLAWMAVALFLESTQRTQRFLAWTLSGAFVLALLPASLMWLTAPRDTKLLDETRTLANQFGERDLILIDRLASGDPFSLLAGPLDFLFHRRAVYFFNPEDLGRIDVTPYSNVYLLVPTEGGQRYAHAWGDRLSPVATHTLTHVTFEGGKSTFSLPHALTQTTTLVVYHITP